MVSSLKPVQVRLSPEHCAWLDSQSKVISRSDVIRLLIEDAIRRGTVKEQQQAQRAGN